MDMYNFIVGANQFDLHFSSSKKVSCFRVYIYVSIQPFPFALRQIFGMIIVRKKGLDCNLSNLPNTLTLFNTYRNMVEHASSLPVIHLKSFSQWVHSLIVHVLSVQAQTLTTKNLQQAKYMF